MPKIKTKKEEEKVVENEQEEKVKEDGSEEEKIQQLRSMLDSNMEFKFQILTLIQNLNLSLNQNLEKIEQTLNKVGQALVKGGEILDEKLSTE